jgi:hypothetical protein
MRPNILRKAEMQLMENIQNKLEEMRKKRKNEIEVYAKDPILSKTIPEVTAQLFYDEFGINLPDPLSLVPIHFTTAWRHILKFVQLQQVPEFSINIGGMTLEYVTENSESDKCRNIVPQLYHTKAPIFKKNHNDAVPGYNVNDEMNNRYNMWRTVNLAETVNKVEMDVYHEILDTYGLDLRVPAAVIPLLAATYAVGLQIAKETKRTVNMYNVFEIDMGENDTVLLTPLAMIKQYLKNDSKVKV